MAIEKLEPLLRTMLSGICRKPKKIEIELRDGIFITHVDPADYGRCVGKKGATFGAINVVLWYASLLSIKSSVQFKLIDNTTGKALPPMPFCPAKKWDREGMALLVEAILRGGFSTATRYNKKALPAYVIEEAEESGDVIAHIRCDNYLKPAMTEPCFEDAAGRIIHAAGMSKGVNIEAKFEWV